MTGPTPRPPRPPRNEGARARARRAMLKRVGARVRAIRDGQGMPRRTLADRSGVSERFLAQLEVGAGNISVARLADVAHALHTSPAALLAVHVDADQDLSQRAAIDTLVDQRTPAELGEVRAWLESRFRAGRGPVVALLGVRGAGKSTIGRRLAARMALPFVELDALIEEAAGLTLAEIFELHGEAYYRRLERKTLADFLSGTAAAVLATGGSLVSDAETFLLLRRRALTVWLKARPEDHWNRVILQGDQRPMAKNPRAMQELVELLAARERLYAAADLTIDTSGLDETTVEDRVASGVADRLRTVR